MGALYPKNNTVKVLFSVKKQNKSIYSNKNHLFCVFVTAAGECRFPEDWVGRWYQSGLGEIIIQKNYMQKKGECAERKKEHYIIFNR